jgi:hypothetical protein
MVKLIFFIKYRKVIKSHGYVLRLFPLRLERDVRDVYMQKDLPKPGWKRQLYNFLIKEQVGYYRIMDLDLVEFGFENGTTVLIIL